MKKLLTVFDYVLWLFLGNTFFIVFNIPILCFLMLTDIKELDRLVPLCSLCLLPVAPSVTALLSVMNKLVKYKSISVYKDYIHAYKRNFSLSIKAGSIYILLFVAIFTNLNVLKHYTWSYYFTPFLYVILFLLIMMLLYTFPLIAGYHIKISSLFTTSLLLTIAKPLFTFTNLLILLFGLILLKVKLSYAILFIFSLSAYMLMMNQSRLFAEMTRTEQTNR